MKALVMQDSETYIVVEFTEIGKVVRSNVSSQWVYIDMNGDIVDQDQYRNDIFSRQKLEDIQKKIGSYE